MATEVARLRAYLDADTRDFDRAMGRSHGKFSKVGAAIKVGAFAAGAAVAYGLGKVAKIGWDEFNQGQQVAAQTNAVLKSTGGVANVTAGDVEKLGEALMRKSGIDDEVIKSGQNMLLTFTDIRNEAGKGNDIFDQATKAALDLSVATGKDLVGANVMVGKALNDPVRGLTALRRVGVQFTEQQEKQIKKMVEAGDTMGAQKVILKELREEFGGSAEAAGKTLGGQINILRERFNNWAGDMVGRVIPHLTAFAEDAMPVIERAIELVREKGQQFIDWFKGSLLPAIESVIETGRELWDKFGEDIKRSFDAAISITKNLLNVIIGIVEFFAAVLRGDWSAAWEALKKIATNAVQALATYLKNAAQNLLALGKALGGALVRGVVSMVTGLASKVGGLIGQAVAKVRSYRDQFFSAAVNMGQSLISGILSGLGGLLDAVYSAVRDALSGAIDKVKGFLHIGSPSKLLADEIGKPMADGIAAGFAAQVKRMRLPMPTVSAAAVGVPQLSMRGAAAGAAGQTVIVNVPRDAVVVDGGKLVRLIEDAQRTYGRRGGGR